MRAHDIRHVRALDGTNGDVDVSVRGSECCGNRDCNYTLTGPPTLHQKDLDLSKLGSGYCRMRYSTPASPHFAPLQLHIFDILPLIIDRLASVKSSHLSGSTSISEYVVIIYHVS